MARRSEGNPQVDPKLNARLLQRVSDGIYFVSRDRHITYWNRGAEAITGYSAETVIGRSCAEGLLRHVNDAGRQLCLHGCPLAGVMKDGVPRTAEIYLHHKDGHRVPISVRGEPILDAAGEIVGAAEIFTSRRPVGSAPVDQPRDDGSIDPVTGIAARRIGELQLQALMSAAAEGTQSLGLLFMDVDHFKAVNDTHGHRVGDEVLRMVATSMANGLRSDDLVARWGGEEFLALLPGANSDSLEEAAERVRMLVENSWIQQADVQVRVTVSIGATIATAADTGETLVDRADGFMYSSKSSGRNRVTSDTGMLTNSAEPPLLGTELPWKMKGVVDVDGFGTG